MLTPSFYLLLSFPEPLTLLHELLFFMTADRKHVRNHIRSYGSALAIAFVRAHFVAKSAVESLYTPAVKIHGRIYYKVGSLNPRTVLKP